MLLFMLMFFMEIRVMLFWLVPAEQLSGREGRINRSGK